MYDAIVIANKFIELSISENNLLSNMKLQKLVYIANGIHLAINDEPLIIEHVEVWPYGPVVSSVYHVFKAFGNSNISVAQYGLSVSLDDKAQKSFQDCWEIAGKISAIQLSNWTHNPDSPWSKARNENLQYIPDEYMQDFFKGFLNAN